jgi:hypothetical protein
MGELAPEQALALGRRMMACRGFRWIRGMTDAEGRLIVDDERRGETICSRRGTFDVLPANAVPDLRDPATASLLPMLVREALGIEDLAPRVLSEPTKDAPPDGWDVPVRTGWGFSPRTAKERYIAAVVGLQPTEVEAWLAAWESV